jgi:8-oxo-dGTP pyrophosphatase MutT (NUDIX family)
MADPLPSAPAAAVRPLPTDAATVVLLREAPLEVFLLRRNPRSSFMGGAFVFPGGKLDAQDAEPASLACLAPGAPARLHAQLDETPGAAPLTAARAAGLHVAALRELFEEAGVLLARPRAGAAAPSLAALEEARAALAAGAAFPSLLAGLSLELDVEELLYWSHWVTPSAEPRRFDTRFFLARLPGGQRAACDRTETTEGRWMAPAAALEAHARGEVFLPPPTQRTLEELAHAGGWEGARALARGRQVRPLIPKIAAVDGRPAVLLPWDPLYAAAEGEGLVVGEDVSPVPQPSRVLFGCKP